jgi:ubiquinone/menaquinone biosynthesis C-methylase UbiE
MNLLGTKNHKQYWSQRKIDWVKAYSSTYNHPHRAVVIGALREFPWRSLVEIGCASGPNLIAIKKAFPRADLGGVDINEDAIATAEATFRDLGFFFEVGDAEDIMMSDDSADVVLTDMTLMYLGRAGVKRALSEILRIARKRVVLVELHSENIFKRWWLRLTSGYGAYNYKRLLSKLGFYDIIIKKITEEEWPGGRPQKTFAYLITAKTQ